MNKFAVLFAAALLLLGVGSSGLAALELEDGTLEGVGSGYGGEITAEVMVEDGEITAIDILEHSETAHISDAGFDGTIERILEEQSVEVDTVTGATMTSEGLLEAIRDALGLEPEADEGDENDE